MAERTAGESLTRVRLKAMVASLFRPARGSLPGWLANAALGAAVFEAYGWVSDLDDADILARLLRLNLDREPA